jgi:DNA-binding Lrp family transcriptional regulator
MKAFVLIKVEPGRLRDVLDRLSDMKAVSEVHCITGPDDIIAVLDSDDARGISEVVIGDLHGVEGIQATDTRLVVDIP